MAYDDSNIFARILRGEIPNDTVAENEHALAFRDIRPQAPIHVLVIPKGAYVSYLEGCTAPMRDENQLHAAVVELIALDDAGLRVLPKGRFFVRAVGMVFDDYLGRPRTATYSKLI